MQTALCINSISPVELHYCLRTKRMLLHRCLVSAVFSRFFVQGVSFVGMLEDLEWVYCKNTRGKWSLCVPGEFVCDSEFF